MTVKRVKDSPYFRYQGHRFRATAKTTDRQKAEAMERAERNRAERLGAAVAAASPWRALSRRYRGLCECSEHAWAALTKGYVTFVLPEDAHQPATSEAARSGK